MLDTHEELILTHQAISDALKGLGREDEAEAEIDLAWESAKRLEIREEKGRMLSDPVAAINSSREQVNARSGFSRKSRT